MQALYDEIRTLRSEMNVMKAARTPDSESGSSVKRDPVAVSLESVMSRVTIHAPVPDPTVQDANTTRDPSQMLSEIQSLRGALTEANSRLSSLSASFSILQEQMPNTSVRSQSRTDNEDALVEKSKGAAVGTIGDLGTAETLLEDEINGDEAVGVVGDINAQILNIAGRVAHDIVEYFPQEGGMTDKDQPQQFTSAKEPLTNVIGGKLVAFLLRTDYVEDPTAVSLAIRSLLTNGIWTMLSIWPLMPNTDFTRDFWTLYKRILKSGSFSWFVSLASMCHCLIMAFNRDAACCVSLASTGIETLSSG